MNPDFSLIDGDTVEFEARHVLRASEPSRDEEAAYYAKRCFGGKYPPAPEGVTCQWCEEAIQPQDIGARLGHDSAVVYIHVECLARMLRGSVGHILQLCPCHGGTTEDPRNMTKRQAALAAYSLLRTLHKLD